MPLPSFPSFQAPLRFAWKTSSSLPGYGSPFQYLFFTLLDGSGDEASSSISIAIQAPLRRLVGELGLLYMYSSPAVSIGVKSDLMPSPESILPGGPAVLDASFHECSAVEQTGFVVGSEGISDFSSRLS